MCRIYFLFSRLEINAATKFRNSLHRHRASSSDSNVVRVNRSNSSNFSSVFCLTQFRIFLVHLLSPPLVIDLRTEKLDWLLITYPSFLGTVRRRIVRSNHSACIRAIMLIHQFDINNCHVSLPQSTLQERYPFLGAPRRAFTSYCYFYNDGHASRFSLRICRWLFFLCCPIIDHHQMFHLMPLSITFIVGQIELSNFVLQLCSSLHCYCSSSCTGVVEMTSLRFLVLCLVLWY